MDSESKTSDRDGSRLSDPPTDSDSDSSGDNSNSDTETQRTEWLATTRQRRSTAGNRMKSMLANEEPDSDLELLFAEDEDDQGFSDVEVDASDLQMDSSSSDEDDNNNNNNGVNGDDLEGEKELERQAKERRAAQRKRKAQEAIPAKFRKKVRIDPTTPAAPAPRPKKKSERASWLPSPADLPTRASSRQTTRISKEQLHQQMVEREARRLKQLAQMQKKAAKLEAMKKPPMTQEERLAEAAVVEKRNSKSLNRWEEAEKQREEERRAKLAALNNRTLKGPVITFWSGVREWKDALGQHVTMVEEKPKKKREKADKGAKDKGKDDGKTAAPDVAETKTDEKAAVAGNAAPLPKLDPDSKPTEGTLAAQPAAAMTTTTTATSGPNNELQEDEPQERRTLTSANNETQRSVSQPPAPAPKQEESQRLMAMPPLPPPPSPAPPSGLAAPAPAPPPQSSSPLATPSGMSRPPESRPSGVLAAPMMAPPPGMNVNGAPMTNAPKSNVLAPPDTSQQSAPPPLQSQSQSPRPERLSVVATPAASEPKQAAARETHLQPIRNPAAPAGKSASPGPSEAPQPPEEPARNSTTARNAIIYRSFDENAMRDKTVQTQILFGRKMTKLSKPNPAPLCVITHHPARYRDAQTGLPYYNAASYREIQRLHKGDYRWSRLIGAWVGSGTQAARGVPERFLHPEPEEERKQRLEEKKKAVEEARVKVEEDKAPGQEERKDTLVADTAPAVEGSDGDKAGEEARATDPAPPAQPTTVAVPQ